MNEQAKELLLRGALQLGIELGPSELGRFCRLADELRKWSRRVNLTAIHDDEGIVVKHYLDSLTLLRVVGHQGRLLDIGSGGGFPSIPVKIVCRDLHVTSVDAVEKKIFFQRHAARLIGLGNFEPVSARGEELAGRFSSHFDYVVSRAFSDIPTFVRIALPLIKESGRIIAMKGRGGREEAVSLGPSLAELGVQVTELLEFTLPFSGDARSLVVMTRSRPSCSQ